MDSDSDLDYYRYHPSAIPNFLPVPTNITVHQGELAKLKCHIYNLGPKLVRVLMSLFITTNRCGCFHVAQAAAEKNKD